MHVALALISGESIQQAWHHVIGEMIQELRHCT